MYRKHICVDFILRFAYNLQTNMSAASECGFCILKQFKEQFLRWVLTWIRSVLKLQSGRSK